MRGKLPRQLARKAFFAQGGTPAMWRGRAACLDMAGSKARKNKNQCRGNDRSFRCFVVERQRSVIDGNGY